MNDRLLRIAAGWGKAASIVVLLSLAMPALLHASCEGCHISLLSGTVRHAPLKVGCGSCHTPVEGRLHPKEKQSMGRGEGVPVICIRCHSPEIMRGAYVHRPMAEGKCLACHESHTSNHPYLLKGEGSTLCAQCHRKPFADPVLHKPVADGNCIGCHDPHAAGSRNLLKGFSSELCHLCHDPAPFQGVSVHKPVEDGDCGACHRPHGSRYPKLLQHSYPSGIYGVFSEQTYALCFDCHDPSLVTDPLTATATRFRNGDQNLHYRHIMLNERGRSCSVCHDIHASNQDHLITPLVKGFGSWEIPISYVADTSGGTCIAGCHKPKSYDRVTYVDNP